MAPEKKLSDVTALVVDNGLFVEIAVKLAKSYKKVYYYCPWETQFAKINEAMIGYGLENIEVVESLFGEHFDEIDIFIFPGIYYGALQTHLVSLGKRVWGARMGEMMELSRDGMKELMRSKGLPVGRYKKVRGMDALETYLKENKNQHVKVNKWRGMTETFRSNDFETIEPKLNEIKHLIGPLQHVLDFIVEDDLPDRYEIGEDMYCIDGQFPSQILAGPEIKDAGYVGVFIKRDQLPPSILKFDQLMAPVFKQYGYRGFFSSESRIGKDGRAFMVDACCRAAVPPNELYQEFYTNFDQIIWEGAGGVLVDPVPIAKFGAEAIIRSTWAEKNYQPIRFPNEYRRYIKFRNVCKIKGVYYIIPQSIEDSNVGAVVGWGDTLEEAIEMVREIAKTVKGYQIEIKTDAFDTAQEEIAKGEKYGVKMF